MPLHNLLHSCPVDTGDVDVVTVFSEETTEGGHVMAVPRNCVFGENIAHSTFIVISVVRDAIIAPVVTARRVAKSVIIAGRPITIAIVTIPVTVPRVVGSVWVAPVPVPPRTPAPTPPPWKAEAADKDDFVEIVEAMKSIIPDEVVVVEAVEAMKSIIPNEVTVVEAAKAGCRV